MTLNDISCDLGTKSSLELNCYFTAVYICDLRVEEVRQNFPLFSVIVEVRNNAKGYPSGSKTLLDSFFLLLQLSFGQVQVPLLLLIARPLSS